VDNDLERLAGALSSLNPSLMRFMDQHHSQKADDDENYIANNVVGKTPEQITEFAQNDERARGAIGMKLVASHQARSVADKVMREAREYLATEFDRDNGDIDAYLNGIAAKAMEENAFNPNFAKEFGPLFDQQAAALREGQAQFRAEQTNDRVTETVMGSWLGTVEAGINSAMEPEAIVNAVRASYDANRAFLGQSYKDQDAATLGLMESLTARIEGDPTRADHYMKILEAVANSDRVGGDGTKLGKFIEGTMGPKVSQLLARAKNAHGEVSARSHQDTMFAFQEQASEGNLDIEGFKVFTEQNPNLVSPSNYQTLMGRDASAKAQQLAANQRAEAREAARFDLHKVNQQALGAGDIGELHRLQETTTLDENGEPKLVSVEDQIKGAASLAIQREELFRARDTQGTPEEQERRSFIRTAEWFSRNPMARHEGWSRTIKSGVNASMSMVENGTVPTALTDGFKLYRDLSSVNPMLTAAYADGPSKNFYEVARALVEGGVYEDNPDGQKQALAQAALYHQNPDKFNSSTISRQRFEELDKQLRNVRSSGWIGFREFGGTTKMAEMAMDIEQLARVYVGAANMMPEDAIARATEVTKLNYRNINGHAVRVNPGMVPGNFEELVTTQLAQYAEANGLDVDDLSIMPMPNQGTAWYIMHNGSIDTLDPTGFVTMDTLQATDQALRDKAIADEVEANERRRRNRQSPITPNTFAIPE
jgi:hypothetical protein